jgi:CitB family two-component system response regulator MalR
MLIDGSKYTIFFFRHLLIIAVQLNVHQRILFKHVYVLELRLMRTLIIDDDKIFVMICKKLTVKSGISEDISVCYNGAEAMDLLQISLAENQLPKIILLDLNMPVMNGWEFLDEFVRFKTLHQLEIPIFIISSTVHSQDIAKANTYTCVKKFFTKPLALEDFEAIKTLI